MVTFGGMRSMWLVTMFDLPTDTPASRRQYSLFRKSLLKDGFWMLQYSVYARHCASDENALVHEARVRFSLPPDGEVRVMKITDKQFGRMQVFFGGARKATERAPTQLTIF